MSVDLDELERMVAACDEAAARCDAAGCDSVEMHLASDDEDAAVEALGYRCRDALLSLLKELRALREAVKPFAYLAGPINGEAGRPSEIELMTGNGECDELELRSHVAMSGTSVILDAADFRRARQAAELSND